MELPNVQWDQLYNSSSTVAGLDTGTLHTLPYDGIVVQWVYSTSMPAGFWMNAAWNVGTPVANMYCASMLGDGSFSFASWVFALGASPGSGMTENQVRHCRGIGMRPPPFMRFSSAAPTLGNTIYLGVAGWRDFR